VVHHLIDICIIDEREFVLKLYRFALEKKEYWETWEDGRDSHIIHWGELGSRGESRRVRSTLFAKAEKIIQKEIDNLVSMGFGPIDLDDHHTLLVEYAVDGMGTADDVGKRHRLEDRMNDTLAWTGLGMCDGGSIGSGSMKVCSYVVDFEVAKAVIEKDFVDTEFANYTRISNGRVRPEAASDTPNLFESRKKKKMSRKRTALLGAIMLLFAGCQFGDELVAYSAGEPLVLASATGSLDSVDSKGASLSPFFHVFEDSSGLRIVMRDYFYNSGPLSRPYLTVDSSGHGVVHIDTKTRFVLFSTKCEFLRQLELKIPSTVLKGVKSLQVYNHDVEQNQSPLVMLSDTTYMSNLLRDSATQLAVQDISGVGSGC